MHRTCAKKPGCLPTVDTIMSSVQDSDHSTRSASSRKQTRTSRKLEHFRETGTRLWPVSRLITSRLNHVMRCSPPDMSSLGWAVSIPLASGMLTSKCLRVPFPRGRAAPCMDARRQAFGGPRKSRSKTGKGVFPENSNLEQSPWTHKDQCLNLKMLTPLSRGRSS